MSIIVDTAFFYLPQSAFSQCSKCLLYYRDRVVDLLSQQTQPFSLPALAERLQQASIVEYAQFPRVWHFFFELGYYFNQLESFIGADDLLAIELEFQKVARKAWRPQNEWRVTGLASPSLAEYQQAFAVVQEHLWRGDCYQVSLTFPTVGAFQGSFGDALGTLWGSNGPAPYAHATMLPSLHKSYISQSPECLFRILRKGGQVVLQTMPIKGSLEFGPRDTLEEKWQELCQSQKDQGELYMIVDLLRNDLNRIELPRARVLRKKVPLVVPGILHQYSLLEAPLTPAVSLGQVVRALFPGGSVTGAPKKRALEVIHRVEDRARGLYTGATLIHHCNFMQASLNIRTATLEHHRGRVVYFSGGGVTLLSEAEREYREALMKVDSFFGGRE